MDGWMDEKKGLKWFRQIAVVYPGTKYEDEDDDDYDYDTG